MNKRNILTAVCALALCPAFAQTSEAVEEKVEYSTDKYKVETNRFWDNWFISAGAGAQIYFGDHDKQQSFGKRLAPALDVAVGKWFTPGIGVRLMYSGLKSRGATKHPGGNEDSAHGNGTPVKGGGAPHWLEESEYNLIKFPQRGVCLYKCGNERYLLEVHAPSYKEKLFGSAGGR